MAQNPKTPKNQNKDNIFSILSEKEKAKLMSLLFKADNLRDQYLEKLEEIVRFFEDLAVKYSYLSEEDEKAKEVYNQITKIVENLKELIYNVPSPYRLLNMAQTQQEN